MSNQPYKDIKYVARYTTPAQNSRGMERQVWSGDIYADQEGEFLVPFVETKHPLVETPIMELHRDERDTAYAYNNARYVTFRNPETNEIQTGDKKILSEDVQEKISVARRFQGFSLHSAQDNEAFLNHLSASGLELSPVHHVTAAWNLYFGDEPYGEILMVKTDEGWREAFAYKTIETHEAGQGKPNVYTWGVWPAQFGFVEARPTGTRDEKLSQTGFSEDTRNLVCQYYIDNLFLAPLVDNKNPIPLIVHDGLKVSGNFKLAAFTATQGKYGTVFAKDSSSMLFVPLSAQKDSEGKNMVDVLAGNAVTVQMNVRGEITRMPLTEDLAVIEPLARQYFEKQRGYKFADTTCRVCRDPR